MAKSVSDIQSGMRFKGAEDSILVTEGEGLRNLNDVYRGLAAALPWPEFTREDTSIQTASGNRYDWVSSVVFLDVMAFEIQDGEDGNKYKIVFPAADMNSLNKSRNKNKQSVPDFYWRFYTGTTHQVELAPGPKFSGKTIRVTGIIEPDELQDGNSETMFIQRAADDAMEWLLASMYQQRDGMLDRAQISMKNAQETLQRLFGRELVPDELIHRIVPQP